MIPDKVTREVVNKIVLSGRKLATSLKSSLPLMFHASNDHDLGSAHGVMGILQMLLTYGLYFYHELNGRLLLLDTLVLFKLLLVSIFRLPYFLRFSFFFFFLTVTDISHTITRISLRQPRIVQLITD